MTQNKHQNTSHTQSTSHTNAQNTSHTQAHAQSQAQSQQKDKIDFKKFDLEAYISEHITPSSKSKSGDAWFICPFHDEKTASLHVTDKQIFHCHGCGADGGVLEFVSRFNNISKQQAAKIVLSKLGDEPVTIDYEEKEKKPFHAPYSYEAVYQYNGGLLYKYRLKDRYIWAHYEDDMWWVGTGNNDIELYQPHGLQGTVVLAEGEKDADTLCSFGFNGASAPNGTYKWDDRFTEALKGADRVVILNDEDYIGIASSQKVQYLLKEAGIKTKRISPLEIIESDKPGFDITDAYEAYGYDTVNKLNELIDGESENDWDELWNDDVTEEETPQVEHVQVEVVHESGLGEDYDNLIEKAVGETLQQGMISELTEIEIKKQAKEHGLTATTIKNRVKNEIANRQPLAKKQESKVMTLESLELNVDISGSGYVIDPNTTAILDDRGDEVIGHFLGFAGVVIDAETTQDTNVKVALAYNTPQNLKKLQIVVVPKKVLATSLDMIKVLSGYNINVSQANGLQVISYLQDIQNFFNERTITMKSLSRFGWYDGKLMPYEQDETEIIFDSTVAQPTADKLLEKKGSREKSLELIKDIATHSEVGATILGASVGSLILSFINDGGNQSFALNVWAGTGTGKSVTTQGVASMFGYPFKDGFWADGNATMNKDIYHNSLLCNLPTFIDDPALNRSYDSFQKRDYVYAVTSGQGRGRMQKDVREWCNVMIMTNETMFIDDNIADGGARARCLEVNFGEKLDRERIDRWIDLMTNNYGHFASEIAVHIREVGKYALESEVKTYIKWFNDNGVFDKRAYNAAIVMVGLNTITLMLDLETNVQEVRDWLAKEIRGSGTLSDGERGYEKLIDTISVSMEIYRSLANKLGITEGALGYAPDGRKAVFLPTTTMSDYARRNNFRHDVVVDWMFKNDKAYAVWDENGKPKLTSVSNANAVMNAVPIYYDWLGSPTTNEMSHLEYKSEVEVV